MISMPLSNQATNALGWALLAIFAVLWWGAKGTLGQQLDRIVSSIHIVSRGPLKGPDPKRLRRAQYHQSPEFFCQRRRAPAGRGYFAVLALTTLHRHAFRRAHTDSLCRS
jgi:hypothetical protein